MNNPEVLVSLDWGGTKISGMLLDRRLGRSRRFSVPAGNLRLASKERLQKILQDVCRVAQLPCSLEKTWWGIGAAGSQAGPDVDRLLEAFVTGCGNRPMQLRLWNDAQTGFAAAFGKDDGILSINGTGCILWGRCNNAEGRRGGWGYLLDETPSGGYFGSLAARGILAAWEGNGETDFLSRLYSSVLPDRPQERADFLRDLYSSSSIQNRVAGLAPLFTAAVDAESAWARSFLRLSLNNWIRDLHSLSTQLKLAFPVSLVGTGGLWDGWPRFRNLAAQALGQTWPGEFAINAPKLTPEWGPLVLAQEELMLSFDELTALKEEQAGISA